jgi:hypothetical protein
MDWMVSEGSSGAYHHQTEYSVIIVSLEWFRIQCQVLAVLTVLTSEIYGYEQMLSSEIKREMITRISHVQHWQMTHSFSQQVLRTL